MTGDSYSVVDVDREEARAARIYTEPAYDDRPSRREAEADEWEDRQGRWGR